MKRFFFTALLVASALLTGTLLRAQPLNILLFTADDLDRNSLGCYGSPVPDITPNLDRFAAEGIRFERAYVNNSICVPSRAILATGLYGHNSGVQGFMKMPENSPHPLIMEILREKGYLVGIMSKVDHSTPKKSFQWDYRQEQKDLGMGRNPDLYYEKALEFLQQCKKAGKPFYFMVNSDDPHRPFFNPDEPLRNGMARPSRIYRPEEVPVPGFLPELDGVRRELSYYYNSVKRMDDSFGKVMQALDDAGLRENTLVIFMSDNGIAVPFGKCDNYYASNRTPWIARLPGKITPGQVNREQLIAEVDFLPTVLEAARIPAPKKLDGASRWPLYTGRKQASIPYVFTQIDNKAIGKPMPMRGVATPMRGIQSPEGLYIFNAWPDGKRIYANNNEGLTMEAMEAAARGGDQHVASRVQFFRYRAPEEFYDLSKDPDCLHNLINDPAYKKDIARYRQAMIREMKKSGDPLLPVYLNRHDPEKIRPLLYSLYPEMKKTDEEGKKKKLNVLFLMSDQHGPDNLGMYGDPHAITPNLDKLAASGTAFTQAYCQNPVCVPSRNSILNGVYSHSNGVIQNNYVGNRNLPSFPQLLRQQGYVTACFGKLHTPGREDLDWDEHDPGKRRTDGPIPEGAVVLTGTASLLREKTIGAPDPFPESWNVDWQAKDNTIRFMRENKDRPWLIQCSMNKPHPPFQPPPKYWNMIDRSKIRIPEFPENDLDDSDPRHIAFLKDRGLWQMNREHILDGLQGYYGNIAHIDALFGEVLEELDRLGLRENTLIIYVADHGEMLYKHGLWTKFNFFDPSVRVPLFFSLPGTIQSGVRSDALVELIDLFPTIMELTGHETPDHVQGLSLVPVLTGKNNKHRDVVFSEFPLRGAKNIPGGPFYATKMIFDGRYKLIDNGPDIRPELYDHATDRDEFHNIAADPAQAERVAQMMKQLQEWSRKDAVPLQPRVGDLRREAQRNANNSQHANENNLYPVAGDDAWHGRTSPAAAAAQYHRHLRR